MVYSLWHFARAKGCDCMVQLDAGIQKTCLYCIYWRLQINEFVDDGEHLTDRCVSIRVRACDNI